MFSDYSGHGVHNEYKVNLEGSRQDTKKYVVQAGDDLGLN